MLYKDTTEQTVTQALMGLVNTETPIHGEIIIKLKELYDNTTDPLRPPKMSDRIYNGRLESFTPIAFTSLLVDKIATLLYGRKVTRSYGVPELDERIKKTYANARGVMMRLTKIASLCGYGAIRIIRTWDGNYKFALYGFNDVKPIFNPEDPYGHIDGIVFDILTEELPDWVMELNTIPKKSVHRFEEKITRHKRSQSGEIMVPGEYHVKVDGKEIKTPYKGLNPLGDYLGAVWWRGLDHPFNAWGKSDILPLLTTLESVNELFTDGRELMIWGLHSPVITNVTGKVDWSYEPRAVWHIDSNANIDGDVFVKRLENNAHSITDLKEFINMLIQELHVTSRIPSVSVGDNAGLGAASSGRAFEIAMTPAKELISEKENCAIPQELELMEELLAKMIYYGDVSGKLNPTPDPREINKIMDNASIDFTPISFPQEVIAETLTGEVMGKIRSQRDAIKHLHPTWDDNMVDEEIKRINEDTGTSEEQERNKLEELRSRINEE